MTGHDRVLDLAAAAIDFDLSPAEQATLERHLASCPVCRRQVARFRADAVAVAALPRPRLVPDRSAVILSAIVARQRSAFRLRTILVVALVALLAATIAFAVGAELLHRTRDVPVIPPPLVIRESPEPSRPVPSDSPDNSAEASQPPGAVEVRSSRAFTFTDAGTPPDLGDLVRGPDGAPFILDRASQAVYRIDLSADTARPIIKAGQSASRSTIGLPRLMTVGGPELLVLDNNNVLWRWLAAETPSAGTLSRRTVNGVAALGDDLLVMGTFCRDSPDCDLINLYLVDPSEQAIWAYSPVADGSGYPVAANEWLESKRDLSAVTDLLIDGDLFVVDDGEIVKFTSGTETGWRAETPTGDPPANPSDYRLLTSASLREEGNLYAFDAANDRIVAMAKSGGSYIAQYRAAIGEPSFADLRGMYLQPGTEGGPDTLWWIDGASLYETILEQPKDVAPEPSQSPAPGPSSS